MKREQYPLHSKPLCLIPHFRCRRGNPVRSFPYMPFPVDHTAPLYAPASFSCQSTRFRRNSSRNYHRLLLPKSSNASYFPPYLYPSFIYANYYKKKFGQSHKDPEPFFNLKSTHFHRYRFIPPLAERLERSSIQ